MIPRGNHRQVMKSKVDVGHGERGSEDRRSKIEDRRSALLSHSPIHIERHAASCQNPKPSISRRIHLYPNPAAKHLCKRKATSNPDSHSDRRSAPARPRSTFPRSSRSARAGRLDGLRVGFPWTTSLLSTATVVVGRRSVSLWTYAVVRLRGLNFL